MVTFFPFFSVTASIEAIVFYVVIVFYSGDHSHAPTRYANAFLKS